MSTAEKSKTSANLHSTFPFRHLCVHYTHILKWARPCISLVFNIGIISHCKSLFSRFLMCIETPVQPGVDNAMFHNPSISTYATLSCRASARSLLGILREMQLRNEAPESRDAVCPRGTALTMVCRGGFNTSCSCHGLLSPRQEGESCKPNHLYRREKDGTEMFKN